MLIVSMSTLFQASPIHASTSYVVHSPILISGNSGFTAQNGVTGGTGTRSDPFLISGWSIVAPYGQAAIYIQSTTAYFSINHVQLLNAQQGIYLTSVTNGSIKNSTLMNSNFGIHIESSTNVTITGNNISGFYGNGVYNADILSAPQTTGLNIANNTFSGAGIVVYSSQSLPLNLNMTKNTFIATGVSTNGYGAIVVRNNLTGTSPNG
jgi:parallel beta-helix repeat protein